MDRHYWKKNEVIFLGELTRRYTNILGIAWDMVQNQFNFKYKSELTISELIQAYDRYYGGRKR